MILKPLAGVRAPGRHREPFPNGSGHRSLHQTAAQTPPAKRLGNLGMKQQEPPALDLVLEAGQLPVNLGHEALVPGIVHNFWWEFRLCHVGASGLQATGGAAGRVRSGP